MRCDKCDADNPADSRFCSECGAQFDDGWKRAALNEERTEAAYVEREEKGSLLFPILTLVFWIVFWPAGLVMNIIGLVTGPRKGCFLAMIIVFVVLFVLAIIAAIAIPNLINALEKSEQSQVRSMLKNISVAQQMYHVENGTYTDLPTLVNKNYLDPGLDWTSPPFTKGHYTYKLADLTANTFTVLALPDQGNYDAYRITDRAVVERCTSSDGMGAWIEEN